MSVHANLPRLQLPSDNPLNENMYQYVQNLAISIFNNSSIIPVHAICPELMPNLKILDVEFYGENSISQTILKNLGYYNRPVKITMSVIVTNDCVEMPVFKDPSLYKELDINTLELLYFPSLVPKSFLSFVVNLKQLESLAILHSATSRPNAIANRNELDGLYSVSYFGRFLECLDNLENLVLSFCCRGSRGYGPWSAVEELRYKDARHRKFWSRAITENMFQNLKSLQLHLGHDWAKEVLHTEELLPFCKLETVKFTAIDSTWYPFIERIFKANKITNAAFRGLSHDGLSYLEPYWPALKHLDVNECVFSINDIIKLPLSNLISLDGCLIHGPLADIYGDLLKAVSANGTCPKLMSITAVLERSWPFNHVNKKKPRSPFSSRGLITLVLPYIPVDRYKVRIDVARMRET